VLEGIPAGSFLFLHILSFNIMREKWTKRSKIHLNLRKKIKYVQRLEKKHIDIIYDDPGILQIDGLCKDKMIASIKEPNFGPLTVDFNFVCQYGNLRIWAIEEKTGLKGLDKGLEDQIPRAKGFFKKNWADWLGQVFEEDSDVLQSCRDFNVYPWKLDVELQTPVHLYTALFLYNYNEPLAPFKLHGPLGKKYLGRAYEAFNEHELERIRFMVKSGGPQVLQTC
jgi:hypothetical protein